jgi:hypothetical protein
MIEACESVQRFIQGRRRLDFEMVYGKWEEVLNQSRPRPSLRAGIVTLQSNTRMPFKE